MRRREFLKSAAAMGAAMAGTAGCAMAGAATSRRFAKDWKVRGRYDLVVVGAGPGGIGTAIAAARRGLRVALIEKAAFPGGAGTQCNVPMFFGFDAAEHQSTAGLSDEFVRRMDRLGAARFVRYSMLDKKHPYSDFLEDKPIGDRELNKKVRFDAEMMKLVYNRMLVEAKVDCVFYTHLADVMAEGGHVQALLLAGVEGTYLMEADVFADCTGDAQLCHLADPASVESVTPERGMHQSIFSDLGGVKPFDFPKNQAHYRELRAKGLTPPRIWDFFGCGEMLNPEVVQYGGFWTTGDVTDSRDLTRMDRELRDRMPEMLEFLRKNMPGFENCWLAHTAHRLGVRVSRRVYGVETLTTDILFGKEYVHPVALCWRHTGGHSNSTKRFNASWSRHEPGLAGVPMGTLLPKAFDNVIVAGRCISAELELVDAYRMMNTCLTMGEAAGLMVYLARKAGKPVKSVAYDELVPLMKENGFILPRQDA